MSLYDRFRWFILHAVAVYHMAICAARVTAGASARQWLHDRPDWFIKYLTLQGVVAGAPDFTRLKRQAVVELDFRRATGVSK